MLTFNLIERLLLGSVHLTGHAKRAAKSATRRGAEHQGWLLGLAFRRLEYLYDALDYAAFTKMMNETPKALDYSDHMPECAFYEVDFRASDCETCFCFNLEEYEVKLLWGDDGL